MKLTNRTVKALRPDPAKDRLYFDDELVGFGVRVTRGGVASWIVQFTTSAGQKRRLTLARVGRLTPDEARIEARKHLGDVARGTDPVVVREEERNRVEAERAEPTLEVAFLRYFDEHADVVNLDARAKDEPAFEARRRSWIAQRGGGEPAPLGKHWKRSLRNDRQLARDWILPRIGSMKLREVDRQVVKELHLAIAVTAGRPIQANRAVRLLSKVLSLSIEWRWYLHVNPCSGFLRPSGEAGRIAPEVQRDRHLSDEEARAVFATLATVEAEAKDENERQRARRLRRGTPLSRAQVTRVLAAGVRLLLLTGMRLRELLTARWEYLDRATGVLTLPTSKTERWKRVVLGDAALRVIDGLPRLEHNPYMLPGRVVGQHVVGLPHFLARVLTRAGVSHARVHDMRHSAATFALNDGAEPHEIGELLGQRDPKSWQRYQHLADRRKRAVADRVGGVLAALDGGPAKPPAP